MSFRLLLLALVLAGCSGRAWNTLVAEDAATRAAMLASLRPGYTTDTEFETRWGKPVQIVREGAQEAWIYRDMRNPPGRWPLQFGDSANFVVVDFQYGIASGGRSSETVGCRATFAPRPPGHAFDNPSTVHPVNCAPGAPVAVALPASGPIPAASALPVAPDPPASAGYLK